MGKVKIHGTCGVYQIRCLANERRYVGGTTNIGARFGNHRHALSQGYHTAKDMLKDWDNYGAGNFAFEVTVVCEFGWEWYYEQAILDMYRRNNPQLLYNTADVALLGRWAPCSQVARDKMSKKLSGRSFSEETLKRMSEGQRRRQARERTIRNG